jgi:geranylgeranyl pyrophosphate synthase
VAIGALPARVLEPAAAQEALLKEFRHTYDSWVASSVERMLGLAAGPARRWLLAPVRHAAGHRTNFFRSALLLESATVARAPEAGPSLAACAEIGWTCALMLDDVFDRSTEREGAACAYLQFGVTRVILAVITALALIAKELAWVCPGTLRMRSGRLRAGVRLVLRSAAPHFRPHRAWALADYRIAARNVNSSIHWALLGPHCGENPTDLLARLERYADHSSVAGKMRNDLVDYWGGSTERHATLEDFRNRELSFPVLVLLGAALDADDRRRVVASFQGHDVLSSGELFALFRKYAVPRKCVSLLEAEILESEMAIEDLTRSDRLIPLYRLLKRWNRHMLDGCRARVLQDPPGSDVRDAPRMRPALRSLVGNRLDDGQSASAPGRVRGAGASGDESSQEALEERLPLERPSQR